MKMSNDTEFGWQSLIKSLAPEGCALAAGLFTTYDRAEARLLAETLLPEWLGLSHVPADDTREQASFALELDGRLKQLHDRLVVVSSTLREAIDDEEAAIDDSLYPWIWRSIRQLTVGKTSQAVQHAKLWLLHWVHPDGSQHLEMVVSSTNLTRAAFRGQIQAAWRVCLPLNLKQTQQRLIAWGVLPGFIGALANSCGDTTHLQRFIDLLARADCPPGVSFVASVPGKHASRTPWGAAGLRSSKPSGRGSVSVSISSPFVGAWSADSLDQWCTQFEGKPERLSLAWIRWDHPWTAHWLLPEDTLNSLAEAGCTLLELHLEPGNDKQTNQFHDEHRSTDERWSHAKVYAFQRGNSRRLLLTSANFSQAAWGRHTPNGELIIENFELGVCIDGAYWPLGALKIFDDIQDAATSNVKLSRSSCLISWAAASWDGKMVHVEFRSKSAVTGEILSRKDPLEIAQWQTGAGSSFKARLRWSDVNHVPQTVVLHCESETMNVPVFDERELAAREMTYPEELSDIAVQELCDQLLLERYGGIVVADDEAELEKDADAERELSDELAGNSAFNEHTGDDGSTDSYAVDTFVAARHMLGVVDNWARLVTQAKQGSSTFILEGLHRDGHLLKAALERKALSSRGIGARLAAEELTLRLRHMDFSA
jgi:hypothetical protein